MKFLQHLMPVFAMMWALPQQAVMAQTDADCTIFRCCDDDCCEPGTIWSAPNCALDTLSPGWIGHGADFDPTCTHRTCCDEDCCEEMLGTVFNPTIGACVPILDGEAQKLPCKFVHELRVFFSVTGDVTGFYYQLVEVHSEDCFAGVESADGVFEFQNSRTGVTSTVNETEVMGLSPLPTLPGGVSIPGTGALDVGSAFGTISSINIDLAVQLTCSCKPELLPRYSDLSSLRVMYNPMFGWVGSPGAIPLGGGIGWQWEQTLNCDGTPGNWNDINEWSRTDVPPPPPPGAAAAASPEMMQSLSELDVLSFGP